MTIAPITLQGRLALAVNVPDWAKLSSILVLIGDASFTNYYQVQFAMANQGATNLIGGWRILYCDPLIASADGVTWTIFGNPAWGVTSFEKLRVRAVPMAGQQVTVQVGKVSFDAKARTQVSIVFDDAWLTTKSLAEPICAALGIPLSTAAIVSRVGQPNYMTLADLKEFQAKGNAVLNHAVENIGALDAGVTTESYTADIAACAQYLTANGLGQYSKHYVFPKGQTTFAITGWLIQNEYKSARTVVKGMFSSANGVLNEKFNIQTWGMDSSYTFDQLVALIKIAIASGKHVVLMGHLLGDTVTSTQWLTGDFRRLMGLLASWRDAGVIDMPLYPEFIDNLL
jgi:hypothetical protein